MIQIHHGDAKSLPYPDNHFDCLVTDPPYGYGFMGKDWDKAVVGVETWREILRVMRPGAFGFIMSAPRQDVLSRMVVNLQEAGFKTEFTSIYWAYATGLPKTTNISKAADKKLGAKREVVGINPQFCEGRKPTVIGHNAGNTRPFLQDERGSEFKKYLTAPSSPEAKALDGAYAGFQPKPAVEVILVVMKPLSEKTYLDQAMKNGKGVTWLDKGMIPYDGTEDRRTHGGTWSTAKAAANVYQGGYAGERLGVSPQGRFPANLLVSDNVLDDGKIRKCPVTKGPTTSGESFWSPNGRFGLKSGFPDQGSFSRYFDLDAWWEALPESARRTLPFLVVPKATKAEKNRGCQDLENETYLDESRHDKEAVGRNNPRNRSGKPRRGNIHPTVKPVKLMSYLIAIGSRPDDIILDPFVGSGTTLVAAKIMGRRAVGVDNNADYIPIAKARVRAVNYGLLF
jgi:hypothetical protein